MRPSSFRTPIFVVPAALERLVLARCNSSALARCNPSARVTVSPPSQQLAGETICVLLRTLGVAVGCVTTTTTLEQMVLDVRRDITTVIVSGLSRAEAPSEAIKSKVSSRPPVHFILAPHVASACPASPPSHRSPPALRCSRPPSRPLPPSPLLLSRSSTTTTTRPHPPSPALTCPHHTFYHSPPPSRHMSVPPLPP